MATMEDDTEPNSSEEVILHNDPITEQLQAYSEQVWQATCDGELTQLQHLIENSPNERLLLDGLYERGGLLKCTTLLAVAAAQGHEHVVRRLIANKKVQVDKTVIVLSDDGSRQIGGFTALFIACREGKKSVAEILIEKGGADISAIDDEGKTSLMWAVFGGNADIVRDLIKRGAHMWERDNEGWTALHVAAFAESSEIIVILIEAGADVDAHDYELFTPLHCAAQNGNTSAMESLLQHGAYIESRNHEQSTPLLISALYGHIDAMKMLLSNGADLHVHGFDQKTALHYAACEGQTEVV